MNKLKRLLLAPLLLGLLISNSALAGRPNPKKEAEKQKQTEYINACNKAGLYSSCNKIFKSNRNKITNESFINSKKIDARRVLDKCIVEKDLWHCYKISGDAYTSTELIKLDWIKDEMTSKDFELIKNLTNQYRVERDKRIEQSKQEKKEKKKKEPEVRAIDIVRFCERLLKENLKDPDSYKRLNSRDNQIATGFIRYSATNSFGGRVQEVYKCFDP